MQFTYRNPDRSTDPGRILAGARSLVVGAWGYRRAEPATASLSDRPAGTVARYARRDHYGVPPHRPGPDRRPAAWPTGWRARVVVDDNALVDRAAAHRAGLGWFGRNTLLLLPGLGSWFVLGSVVTDAPLVPTPPAGPSDPAEGCGSCRRCMTACPTGALVADGVLDAGRCLAWLVQAPGTFPVEFREALGDRIYGCDDCQQVCPDQPGRPTGADLPAPPEAGHGGHGRPPATCWRPPTPTCWPPTGGGTSPGATPATCGATPWWRWATSVTVPTRPPPRRSPARPGGDDELLAEHARWAADRLGRGRPATAPATGSAT